VSDVRVQSQDFDAGAEIARLAEAGTRAGAIASFVGIVRSEPDAPITAMVLEHYPGMTERQIATIAAQAETRFALTGCTIIHRFGRLAPGAQIVFVGAAAPHRRSALDGVTYLMDWLKTHAPFWKQEVLEDGTERWVEAKGADDAAAARW
jgi:molybdopterin synthase catalytic subunit